MPLEYKFFFPIKNDSKLQPCWYHTCFQEANIIIQSITGSLIYGSKNSLGLNYKAHFLCWYNPQWLCNKVLNSLTWLRKNTFYIHSESMHRRSFYQNDSLVRPVSLNVWDIDIAPSHGKFTRWPRSLDSGQEHAICRHGGTCWKPEPWTPPCHLVYSHREHPHGSSTVSGAVEGQRLACHLVPRVIRRRTVALGACRFQVRFSSMTHIMEWVGLAVVLEVFFFPFL